MLFSGLFSWCAMPDVSTPSEASFFSCTSWFWRCSSSTSMWLNASTTPRVSSLVAGRGSRSRLPRTICRAERSMTDSAPRMRRPMSHEKNAASPTMAPMDSSSWCFSEPTIPRMRSRW